MDPWLRHAAADVIECSNCGRRIVWPYGSYPASCPNCGMKFTHFTPRSLSSRVAGSSCSCCGCLVLLGMGSLAVYAAVFVLALAQPGADRRARPARQDAGPQRPSVVHEPAEQRRPIRGSRLTQPEPGEERRGPQPPAAETPVTGQDAAQEGPGTADLPGPDLSGPEPVEPPPVEPEYRTWTDASGKFTVEARFGGMAFGKVTLIKRDGSAVEIPEESLSGADREWIHQRKLNPRRRAPPGG